MGKNMFKINNDCADAVSVGVNLVSLLVTLNRNLSTVQKYSSGSISIQIQQQKRH